MPSPSPARWLAPLSLVACTAAVLAILSSGGGGGGATPAVTEAPAAERPKTRTSTTPARRPAQREEEQVPSTYVVKPGDSFSTIADRTGVPLDELRRLNPDVDAQALRVGQEIELGR